MINLFLDPEKEDLNKKEIAMNFNKKPKQKKSSFSFVKSYEGSSDKLPKPFFYAIIGIIYVLFILLYYYFILPALNFNSIPSWIFVFFIMTVQAKNV